MDIHSWMKQYQIECTYPRFMEAITHPSIKAEDNTYRDYEQLETIGDAVLDLLILEYIIHKYPDATPSQLTKGRSNIVNNKILGKLGRQIYLDEILRISNGYTIVNKDLSNALEAIFGAIYLDNGLLSCKKFLEQLINKLEQLLITEFGGLDIDEINSNPIGKLQEIMQKNKLALPEYEFLSQEGPDNDPVFTMRVSINYNEQEINAIGRGNSKKIAREKAARAILEKIDG